jgi:hypothetical protein
MYWSEKRNKKSTGLGGGVSGTLKKCFGEAVKRGHLNKNQPQIFLKYIKHIYNI